MIPTFFYFIACLCFMVPGCNWVADHPKEVKAIEGDLEDIAEQLIPGAPTNGSRPQVTATK
jgi:hypothetical protein